MNHDYAHCLDYDKSCPKQCFRAELERDLSDIPLRLIGITITWSHFIGTSECNIRRFPTFEEYKKYNYKIKDQPVGYPSNSYTGSSIGGRI